VAHVSLGEQRHLPPPLDVDNYDKKYGLTENLLGTLVNAFNAEALVVCQHSIEPLPDVEPADLSFWLAPTSERITTIDLYRISEPQSHPNRYSAVISRHTSGKISAVNFCYESSKLT
jgi:hypothetical protein